MSWGVAVVSASAAILRRSLAPKPWDCKALPLVGLARASSAEALGTLRLPLESVWIQDAQNDLAAGKTLGITSKQASASCMPTLAPLAALTLHQGPGSSAERVLRNWCTNSTAARTAVQCSLHLQLHSANRCDSAQLQ